MDFSDENPIETDSVEYFETDEYNTSEQYDFTLKAKKSNDKLRLKLSDFYSDDPGSDRDLLWKYMIYINLLRDREMNYLEYHLQCREKLLKAIENAKIQIVQGLIKNSLECVDTDSYFDELELQIDKFASKCIDCLDYKISFSLIQLSDSLLLYGPVVISILTQLKTMTLRLMESKRIKLSKCLRKLIECMNEVGLVICESRKNEFKSKTFDLTSKMNDMQGRNDLFMQYRSNLMLRYLDHRDSIIEFLRSNEAESIISDSEFNFSSDFMHMLPMNGDFTNNEQVFEGDVFSEKVVKEQEAFNEQAFDEKAINEKAFDEKKSPKKAVSVEFDDGIYNVQEDVIQSNPDEISVDYQIDARALEIARSKATAILRRKRELQKKIQMQSEQCDENIN